LVGEVGLKNTSPTTIAAIVARMTTPTLTSTDFSPRNSSPARGRARGAGGASCCSSVAVMTVLQCSSDPVETDNATTRGAVLDLKVTDLKVTSGYPTAQQSGTFGSVGRQQHVA